MPKTRLKLGSSPCSWGIWFPDDPRQMPWQRCLDEISKVGYEWIELGPYGYLPTQTEVLKKELADRSLAVSGTFTMGFLDDPDHWPALEAETIGACRSLVSVGAGYLIVIDGVYADLSTGEMLRSDTLNDREWHALIDTTHRIARIAEHHGLRAVFHPHAETHVETEEQIERFLADTNPDLIALCLDTGHHAYRGGDPVAFYKAHADRIEYFHLKNVDPEIMERVRLEGIPFARAVQMGVFCEPVHGAVDFAELAQALADTGFDGHATVEQDMYPAPPDKPFPIAQRTYQYLRSLGL
ncbi:MAG: sugar phosphate isomerase/epimerase [bacterium]|nr:sugar phosphate isomerase/epimerase [bacterium]